MMPTPSLERLRPNELMVDGTVQRPLDERRIASKMVPFRPDAIGTITVSARDTGELHIVDGQHRMAAARAAGHGDSPFLCMVYRGLSKAREASLFLVLNNTRQAQPLDKFRVRVAEGEAVAVTLNSTIMSLGWTVEGNKRQGSFAAVAALEWVYNGGGIMAEAGHLETCHTMIEVATNAWGHNADGVRNEIVKGLGLVLLRHGSEIDYVKLQTSLAVLPGAPLSLIGDAKILSKAGHGNVSHAMAEIIVNVHNKGRRASKLPDWKA